MCFFLLLQLEALLVNQPAAL